jgi:hypothetical protein
MEALPVELQNHIWSFVGMHPIANMVKPVSESYLSCDDIYIDQWEVVGMSFKDWYFGLALPDCIREINRLNKPFSYHFREKGTHLFNPEFYNLQILELGCDTCDRCNKHLNFVAVNNYNGYCESCYAFHHGIATDIDLDDLEEDEDEY